MKEGEPILGGPQANPGAANVPNPGTQPVIPAAPQPLQPQIQSQPLAQSQISPQPIQPASVQPQPISSGTDDAALLNSASKQKNKKTPIIALVILLVVCIISIFAYFLIPNQANNIESNSVLAQDFNLYANNLLFGEEKTDPIVDFDVNEWYYIDENYGDTDYLKSLLSNYDEFLTQAESSNNQDIKNIPLQESKEQLEFLIQYNELGFIENTTILDIYNSEGPVAAESAVKEYYNIKDGDSESLKTFKEYGIQVALAKIGILSNESPSDDIKDTMSKIYEMLVGSVDSLKTSCKNINLIINGDGNV